ncbi:SPOSA6832_03090, partial [Sporobolomyces salmonicolor]
MASLSVFNPNLYQGKVVFVTGGGSGICYAMTEALMRHGASAAIFGRRAANIQSAAAALSKATGQRCIGLAGDVRKLETLEEAAARTVAELGRIDYVICGAAGNFLSPLEGLSPNAFRTVLEIDTIGTYNTYKATIAEVVKTRGSYIAVSATLHYKGTALQAHVSAAKAGVDALFRVMAVEYGPRGVRANVIAPGPIDGTEGISRLLPPVRPPPRFPRVSEQSSETHYLLQDVREQSIKRIPLQRFGTPEDIAQSALFLFSPAASYITGTVTVVDGGDYHTFSSMGAVPYPEAFQEGGPKLSKL